MSRSEKRGEGKEIERRQDRRRKQPPLKRYQPGNKEKIEKISKVCIILLKRTC
jgi:hypothetical protein